MLCFEVHVNGKLACTAGAGDEGVLSAIVTWAKRDAARCPENLTPEEWCREGLDLDVGGTEGSSGEHVRWLRQTLQRGDEVTIRVVERAAADPPTLRTEGGLCVGQNTFDGPNEAKVAVRSRQADPASGRSYEVCLTDVIPGDDPMDDSVDVGLVFEGGPRYVATFFNDPQKGKGPKGRVFWEADGMILVPELSHEVMLEAVATLVAEGNLKRAFRHVEDTPK
jgi:hypothetical protein